MNVGGKSADSHHTGPGVPPPSRLPDHPIDPPAYPTLQLVHRHGPPHFAHPTVLREPTSDLPRPRPRQRDRDATSPVLPYSPSGAGGAHEGTQSQRRQGASCQRRGAGLGLSAPAGSSEFRRHPPLAVLVRLVFPSPSHPAPLRKAPSALTSESERELTRLAGATSGRWNKPCRAVW